MTLPARIALGHKAHCAGGCAARWCAEHLTVTIVDAANTTVMFNALEARGADFGVVDGTKTIYYDQNNFWQNSVQMVTATLVHEFSHVNGYSDAQDPANLHLAVGAATVNITLKLGYDGFRANQ